MEVDYLDQINLRPMYLQLRTIERAGVDRDAYKKQLAKIDSHSKRIIADLINKGHSKKGDVYDESTWNDPALYSNFKTIMDWIQLEDITNQMGR